MSIDAFIFAFVVNALWQSTLLTFLGWTVLRVFHETNATTRHAVWLGVISASVALPLAATISEAVPVAVAPPPVTSSLSTNARTALAAALRGPALLPPKSVMHAGPPQAHFLRTRFTVPAAAGTTIAWVWAVIAAALLTRLALSLFYIEGLKRDALPLAPERCAKLASSNRANRGARDARLCVSARATVPTTIGLFDAMVLIPETAEQQLGDGDLDRIVLHELAHLRRRDDWTNALAQLVKSLLFFSPAVILGIMQLDLEREVACDDSVLECDAGVLAYANTLARMADIRTTRPRQLGALGIFTTRRDMSVRIERILEDGRDVRGRLASGPSLLALCAIAAISLTAAFAPSIALGQMENADMGATPIGDAAPADIAYTGTWELRHYSGRLATKGQGRIFSSVDASSGLLFDLHYPSGFTNWTISADLKALGIDPERLRAAQAPVSFVINREAGTFDCNGDAGDGIGKGEFRFRPNAAYATEYWHLGMRLSLRDQVVAGMVDVPLDYVRGLAAIGMTPMSFQSLISLKMMGGSLERVRALRRDFPKADAQAMTSFIMLQKGVPDDTDALHALFPDATIDDVMTMGMAGITPNYVGALQAAGVRGLSAINVTALRSAGVDKAFVERMIARGRTGLTIDEVVALKKSGF